jgi:glycosyltransferase involved in cell wall biosynthesis
VTASTSILIITPDVITAQMAGPAIRAWEFARLLTAAGHRVTLAAQQVAPSMSAPFTLAAYTNDQALLPLARDHKVLLLQGLTISQHAALQRLDKIFVIDFYDPFLLEMIALDTFPSEQMRQHIYKLHLGATRVQAQVGDFFICASEQQRDYWLGVLSYAGRVNRTAYVADSSLRNLIDVVSFGLAGERPGHTRRVLRGVHPCIGADDPLILWNGGIYNWFDPFTVIRAMQRVVQEMPHARLFFMGTRHPNPDAQIASVSQQAMALARELGLLDRHVFFNDAWVPYEERHNYLLEADVAVSAHLDTIETQFSFRTRILDCIWAGLPLVSTRGGSLPSLMEAHGLGVTVGVGDETEMAEALLKLLHARGDRSTLRPRFSQLAESFTWEQVSQPLLDFCAHPQKAADRRPGVQDRMKTATLREYHAPTTVLGKLLLYLRLFGIGGMVRSVWQKLTHGESG